MTNTPIRNAATVMLVRPTERRFDVLMLQRTSKAAFAGGMYVFPGGALDASDDDALLTARIDGLDSGAAADRLGTDETPLAWWIAAIRESFEEAGVLIGADHADADELREARSAMLAGTVSFADVLERFDVRLPLDRVAPVSRWITPNGEVRRFDTRFFVAAIPADVHSAHDDVETVDSVWIDPADALERHQAGSLAMILPTVKHVEFLARYSSIDELFATVQADDFTAAASPVQPRLVKRDGRIAVLLPGDEGYDEARDEFMEPRAAGGASS
jgi:8-oxo-dGTP pyrophosphatase MutT (NUDIX family)